MIQYRNYFGRYLLFSTGKLFSIKSKKYIKVSPDILGYSCCNLYDGKKYHKMRLHRMMAENFLVNSDNLPQVNHINGNKEDYSLNNLEWCTNGYNVQHSYSVLSRGVSSKLTLEDVDEIIFSEKNTKDLSKEYGVCTQHINALKRGEYQKRRKYQK